MADLHIEQGYIKLHKLVLELIANNRLTTLHRYVWYLHYMIDGYQRLLMSQIPVSQTTRVKLNKAKMVDFPDDFLGLLRIGIPKGDRVVPLRPSPNLVRNNEDDKSYQPAVPDLRGRFAEYSKALAAYDYQPNTRKQGHNGAGYFTINYGKRRIELSVDIAANIGDTLFLEYVANGVAKMNTETEVYYPAGNMLKQWANYQWAYYKFGANHGETRAQKQQFMEERDEFKANISDLTADSIIGAMNQTAHIGPKF